MAIGHVPAPPYCLKKGHQFSSNFERSPEVFEWHAHAIAHMPFECTIGRIDSNGMCMPFEWHSNAIIHMSCIRMAWWHAHAIRSNAIRMARPMACACHSNDTTMMACTCHSNGMHMRHHGIWMPWHVHMPCPWILHPPQLRWERLRVCVLIARTQPRFAFSA
jgi:hypothetical protein